MEMSSEVCYGLEWQAYYLTSYRLSLLAQPVKRGAGFSLCNGHVRPPVRLSVPPMAAATFDPHLATTGARAQQRASGQR